jgi:hypothetical protein
VHLSKDSYAQLFCASPNVSFVVYQSAGDFRYHVSNQKEDVTFSAVPFIFSKYVPTSPRKKAAEDGADLLDDPLND